MCVLSKKSTRTLRPCPLQPHCQMMRQRDGSTYGPCTSSRSIMKVTRMSRCCIHQWLRLQCFLCRNQNDADSSSAHRLKTSCQTHAVCLLAAELCTNSRRMPMVPQIFSPPAAPGGGPSARGASPLTKRWDPPCPRMHTGPEGECGALDDGCGGR
jgi:hypothetical protein